MMDVSTKDADIGMYFLREGNKNPLNIACSKRRNCQK